jgi:O-antigen ligase
MRRIAYWLSLVLIFTMPWENLVDVGAQGTIARVVGLVLVAAWLSAVVLAARVRRPSAFHAVVFAFFLWNAATLFWTVDLDSTLISVFTYVQLLGLVVVIWDLYETPEYVRAALQAYVLGSYISVSSLVVNYFAENADSSHSRMLHITNANYSDTGFYVNDLGLILVLGVPMAWYLALSKSQSRLANALKLINYLYVLAAVVGVVLTESRAAFLGMLPAALFILGSVKRLKIHQQVLLCGGLVAALVLAAPLVPEASVERLATTGSEMEGGDINGRMRIWRDGISAFTQRPLAGFGTGAFRAAVPCRNAEGQGCFAHNFIILFLVEDGLVGSALFGLILVLLFRYGWRQPKWESRLWLTMLTIWLIGATSHNWEQRKQTWLLFNLIVISASLPVSSGFLATEGRLAPGENREAEA